MSTFTDAPFSYVVSSSRTLKPENSSPNPNYVFNAGSGLETDSTVCSNSTSYYNPSYIEGTGGNPPNIPPSIPYFPQPPTDTQITAYFSVAGITGNPAPTFAFLFGPTNPPTTPYPALKLNPDLGIYYNNFSNLQPSTTYYFRSVATNSGGTQISDVISVATSASGGTPPNAPPTVPTLTTSFPTSLSVSFDTLGITGGPTPTFSILWGTSPTTVTTPAPASLFQNTEYTASVFGLKPSTNYYFISVAANGNPPNQLSAVAGPFMTAPTPTPTALKTLAVLPFLIQGPRFNQNSPWDGIDYYIATGAVGCTAVVGTGNIQGQQLIGNMYFGTVGNAGNLYPGQNPPVPYAGSCVTDQPFAALMPDSASDDYIHQTKLLVGQSGKVLLSWGGYLADVRGLFGPYIPAGYPGTAQPTAQNVVQSLTSLVLNNAGPNPLGWVRTNSTNTSGFSAGFDGIVLDFENIGYGNNLNNYPYAQPGAPPQFPADAMTEDFDDYALQIGLLPSAFWYANNSFFLSNAPVSLSIFADGGNTNISACNSDLNRWFPFATRTKAPTMASYNDVPETATNALNHPSRMRYMDDVFVQYYNEAAADYIGGANFVNILAGWGFLAIKAQQQGPKTPKINLGFAYGATLPGRNPANNLYTSNGQGPTPALGAPPNPNATSPPFTYWYPTYCGQSPPNYTDATNGWPNTGPALDAKNLAAAIVSATQILQSCFGDPTITASTWCSGMGFWAGGLATTECQKVYTGGNPDSPGMILPADYTYCWSDAQYPAPDPGWTAGSNLPIQNKLNNSFESVYKGPVVNNPPTFANRSPGLAVASAQIAATRAANHK